MVLQEKTVLLSKYRKSELIAAVINIQSCSASQYVKGCEISNPQYLMRIELLVVLFVAIWCKCYKNDTKKVLFFQLALASLRTTVHAYNSN